MLAVASVFASGGNYAVNIFTARWLSPAEFSDANLMVTIMLTVTSVAMGLQLVAAHVVSHDEPVASYAASRHVRTLRWWAWGLGIALAATLSSGSVLWSTVFNTASAVPFLILGIGMPFYFAQAVSRGVLQGRLHFAPLAWSFVIEMIARVGVVVALVAMGAGVEGATVGLTASFIATWIFVSVFAGSGAQNTGGAGMSSVDIKKYSGFVAVLLIGQMIANNSDVFAAKIFLEPADAGVYSSVALIGRAVFFVSWSVATVVFPAVARRAHLGGGRTLLLGGIVAVLAMGLLCSIAALLLGGPSMEVLFGPEYVDLGVPLASYAAMTTVWAIANLTATSRLSLGKNDASWIILGGGFLQVALLMVMNDDVLNLVAAQSIAGGAVIVALLTRPNILLGDERTLRTAPSQT
jgi:O-antigen/teichoic acid export membrane protein